MRVSSLLGLSVGWLLTCLVVAFDVGAEDLIFVPTLALGLPALIGLGLGIRAYMRASPPEPLKLGRLVGFGVLGALFVTLAVLGLIAIFYWGEPLPPA